MFGGDFKEIMSYDEKKGGAMIERREITHFRNVVDLIKVPEGRSCITHKEGVN